MPDVAAEKAVKHQLVVHPQRDGLFMMTATVETGEAAEIR